jgi:uncharacterized protein (TIGR02001 family)
MRRPALRIAACLLFAPVAATAGPKLQASVMLASDNLLRGVSRSDSEPAVSAQVQLQSAAGWFGSLWASSSRVGPDASATVDLAATLGYAFPLNADWAMRASYSHYESPWQPYGDFYRYDELTLDARLRETLLLSVSYSPNTSRYASDYGAVRNRRALAAEATYQLALRPGLLGFAGAGYYDLSDLFGEGYWYGSVGLNWSWQRWQLGASWVFTDEAATRLSYVGDAGNRALFSVSYVFRR